MKSVFDKLNRMSQPQDSTRNRKGTGADKDWGKTTGKSAPAAQQTPKATYRENKQTGRLEKYDGLLYKPAKQKTQQAPLKSTPKKDTPRYKG